MKPDGYAPPSPKPKARINIGKRIKENVPGFLVSVSEGAVEITGRVPNPPDPDIESDLQDCTDQLIDSYAPKIEVSPLVGLLFCMAALTVGMWYKAPKKAPKGLPAAAKSSASATGEKSTTNHPQSSSPVPSLSLVADDGNATNADKPSSGE